MTVGPKGLFGDEDTVENIGLYRKLNQSTKSDLPASAYSYRPRVPGNDPKGPGPIRRVDSDWGVQCMEPTSSAWFAYKLSQLQKNPGGWHDFDFGDSGGTFAFGQGGNHPLDPVTGKPYTQTQFLAAIAANVLEWERQTSRPILLNGLSRATIDLYGYPAERVGMVENAFGSNKGVLPSFDAWQKNMALLGEAQDKGWTPWAFVKLKSDDPAVHSAFRNLCVPSILLADKGSLLYSQSGDEGSDPAYVTGEWQNPLYSPDIGAPLHTETDYTGYEVAGSNGPMYVRHYEKGAVVVNPGHAEDALGYGRWGEGFYLPPQSGVILKGVRSPGPLEQRSVVGGS
jgi:hypothetical protein